MNNSDSKPCGLAVFPRGFTLIEIVIVLVIASILLTAAITLARPYFEERQRLRTVNSVRNVERALANYVERVGAYPCPAPANTQRGTEEDGRSDCSNPPTQSGITVADGRPDAAGVPRPVLIGAVPYRDLGIPVDSTIDAYANRLSYAVSLPSTTTAYNDGIDTNGDSAVMDNHTGAIEVLDESGNSLLEKVETSEIEAGSAHVFFFSHGRNGKGAFTNDGVTTNTAIACTASVDAQNCDGDAVFVAALQSHGEKDHYYDDISAYSLMIEGEDDDLWDRTPSNPNNIYNLNTENVGIGTENPETKLDVRGSVSVQDGWLVMRNSGDPVANPTHYPQIRFLHPKTPTGPSPLEDWASIGIARENNTGVAGLALSGQNNLNGTTGIQDVHMFVANNGEVGIGTTDPLARLHAEQNNNDMTSILVRNTTVGSNAMANVRVSSDGNGEGWLSYYSDNYSFGNRQHFRDRVELRADSLTRGLDLTASAPTGDIGFYAGGEGPQHKRMHIAADGNVGIMTQTPQTKLDVAGEIKIGNAGLQPGCVANKEGAMRYNPTIKNVEFCDGVVWKNVTAAPLAVGHNSSIQFPIHTFSGTLPSSLQLAVPENGKWAATFVFRTPGTDSAHYISIEGADGNFPNIPVSPWRTLTWIGNVSDGNISINATGPAALISWHAIKVQ